MNVLHIHGQRAPHDPSLIVGTPHELRALAAALLRAATAPGRAEATTSQAADGEGYVAVCMAVSEDDVTRQRSPYTGSASTLMTYEGTCEGNVPLVTREDYVRFDKERVAGLFVEEIDALVDLGSVQCGCCGSPAEGNYSLDIFDNEDDVPICNMCGSGQSPTIEEIRAATIARRQHLRSKAFDKEVMAVQP